MTEKTCSCDTRYFGHEPDCVVNGVVPPSAGVTALRLSPGAMAAMDEIDQHAWKNTAPGSVYWRNVLNAVEEMGLEIPHGLDYELLIELLRELQQRRDDYLKLHAWLTSHTKVDPTVNAVTSAITLLETARMMVHHLTPAVMGILKSGISALQSAGVDIPQLVGDEK